MNTTLLENIIWILDKLDKTGELSKAYKEGKIYISDCNAGKRYLYEPNNPDHAKFKQRIDNLSRFVQNKDEIAIYHIITGTYDLMGEDADMDNYLYLTLEYDYFKEMLNADSIILAYVDNVSWDVQESGSIRVVNKKDVLYRSA